MRRLGGFCRKDFWNQGKAVALFAIATTNFAERTFGIKAKHAERVCSDASILPKGLLESRQS